MDVDAEKMQQAVLALLYLNTFSEKSGKRAWKALPWSVSTPPQGLHFRSGHESQVRAVVRRRG